jgi:uncharacterized membrane protein YqjE
MIMMMLIRLVCVHIGLLVIWSADSQWRVQNNSLSVLVRMKKRYC